MPSIIPQTLYIVFSSTLYGKLTSKVYPILIPSSIALKVSIFISITKEYGASFQKELLKEDSLFKLEVKKYVSLFL